MTRQTFPVGKLPPAFFEAILKRITTKNRNKRIIAGPGIGKDVAVIEYTDRYGVFTTDPITFATDQIGYYAVHVNANDIYTSGADPLYFLPTVLLPEGKTTEQLVMTIFDQIHETCSSLRITVIGGHTEVTTGIDKPIIAGTMYGEVDKKKYVGGQLLQPNDVIILAGAAAIEATAIIAREKEGVLKEKGYSDAFITKAKDFLFTPGISIRKAAKIARKYEMKRMHDATEGGIVGSLWEVVQDEKVGMKIEPDAIPLYKISKEVCQLFHVDPLRVIASGALLIFCSPKIASPLLHDLTKNTIQACCIGQIDDNAGKVTIRYKNHASILSHPSSDEITKIF